MYDPPEEWEEVPVPADLSPYTPDFYDEEWGTFNPDDEDWQAEEYRRLVPDFNIYYDREQRRWICDCARYLAKGACLHSYKYRGEEIVAVNEEYL
jgi:hypothetical protein